MLQDDALLARIESGFETAGLSPQRLAVLRYACKLTETPSAVEPADVDDLRQVGFTDPDILAIAEVVAYYAYANRIADGLGVQLESGPEAG